MGRLTTEEFIFKIKIIHADRYDYSLVNFINIKVNIKIICSKHGIFEQRPQHHLAGHGCNKCAREFVADTIRLTKKTCINKANKVHGDKYDYSLVDFSNVHSNKDKIDIICHKHGKFNQAIKHHLNGSGCPVCNESKGEETISKYLINNNIKFIRQHRYKDCRDKKPLPFDFYLPDLNMCIEYDGEQHFKSVNTWGGEKVLLQIQKHDRIKNSFCICNNIQLIRIKYNENIIDKLPNCLN